MPSLHRESTCHLGKAHQLTINFRSTQEILDFATFIRSKVNGGTAQQLRSGQNKHGPMPTYLYTRTGSLPEMVDATLGQIAQLSASEKESIVLIFGNKKMLPQAQNLLKGKLHSLRFDGWSKNHVSIALCEKPASLPLSDRG